MLPRVALRSHLSRVFLDRRIWALVVLAGVGATYPMSCGALGGYLVTSKLSTKLGVPVHCRLVRAGWSALHVADLTVGRKGEELLTIPKAEIPFSAAWGSGTITWQSPRIDIRRGVPGDNVSTLVARLHRAASQQRGFEQPASYPAIVIRQGSLMIQDGKSDLSLAVGRFDATWKPSRTFSVTAHDVAGNLGTDDDSPSFGAQSVAVAGPLSGMRPHGFPEISVKEGHVRLLRNLPLTGITGRLRPTQSGEDAVDVLFSGSYGGAKHTLWNATGRLRPAFDWSNVDGQVALRAERFSLDKIAEVLPPSVLNPEDTDIDATIEAHFSGRRIGLSGSLNVDGLSISEDKLASEPVEDVSFTLRFDATVDRDRRRLDLAFLDTKIGSLLVRLSGSIALPVGTFKFKNGHELKVVPKIDLDLRVPRTSCEKILTSIPAPLVPHLRGFTLQGLFSADIHANVDFSDLDALTLGGKVGINGCRVVKAPDEVLALTGPASILQTVDVPPPPSGSKNDTVLTFAVGPDNPDFVPYDKISPYVTAAFLTTEDSGFFKHHGWVTSQFKTALRRNLAAGGFRLGASSITMQMVKNLLLSREKTLSRKFQELFLVWYVEQILTKERILELYFNAIEFGPRLYGIGPAARHYFGKSASDLTPLESAFLASILPSPKRRYVQYCHGSLTPRWQKYVHRILSRMHERGRLNDEEYATALASTLVFDKTEMTMTERQCLDWVHKMTATPEPEPDPDVDGQ